MKAADVKLNSMGEFEVNESKGLNIFASLFFYAMFVSAFFDFEDGVSLQWPHSFSLAMIALVPALFFTYKSTTSRRRILLINKQGIFYFEKHITSWQNFQKAKIAQEEKVFQMQDNFRLFLEYYSPDRSEIRTSKIALGNTQNKSEEEVLAAIQYFYDQYYLTHF